MKHFRLSGAAQALEQQSTRRLSARAVLEIIFLYAILSFVAFTPTQAAQMLGVSPGTLRRIASIYEAIYGELPTDSRGRVYPDEAINRLSAARALVADRQTATLEQALKLEASSLVAVGLPADTQDVFTEVQRLRQQLARQHEALEHQTVLLESMDTMLRELKAENNQVKSLPASTSDLVEARRMNGYLLGELQRRRGEQLGTQTSKRAWWHFWKHQ